MGFATLLGGTCTTIGTSTNLLVVSVAADMGMRRLEMFDFLVPAIIAGIFGILYLWLVVPRMLPPREPILQDASPRIFSAHLAILEKSPVEGKTLSEALKQVEGKMQIQSIQRGPDTYLTPLPGVILKTGDHLILRDTSQRLKEFEKVFGGTLYPAASKANPLDEENPLKADDQQIAELVVTESSFVSARTLSEIRFAEQYGLIILAIHRAGKLIESAREDIGDVRLKPGDILLVQGPREQLASLRKMPDFLTLDSTADLPFAGKAPLALAIMAGIILLSAFDILPISISAPLGALAMILARCLNWRDATGALSAQVILIVVASLALGSALLKTGGVDFLAQVFLSVFGNAHPALVISGLMLLMAIFTNIVSNNAAAIIGTPIAITIAERMGLPPEPFVLSVLFGANMSYATPMAYKTNLLIMTAGNYAFMDFIRAGVPLALIMWLSLSWLLPTLYGIGW